MLRRTYQWLRHRWFPETQLEGFDAANKHVYSDLSEFEARVHAYSALPEPTRRTVRLILQVRADRATPSKADVVRAAAVSSVTTVVALLVAFSAQWVDVWVDLSVLPWITAHPDEVDASEAFVVVTKWLLAPVLLAIIAIVAVPHLWGSAISGSDRRRTIYLAWLQHTARQISNDRGPN